MKINVFKSTIFLNMLILLCLNFTLVSNAEAHWASEIASDFFDKGYVSNMLDSRALDSPILKGEFAQITNRYYSFDTSESIEEALKVAEEQGYMKNVLAQDAVSREEACAIFCKLTTPSIIIEDLKFSDYGDVSKWAVPYVSTAIKEGLFIGYPDNSFKPLNKLTKAEFLMVLSRITGVGGPGEIQEIELIDDEKINDIEIGIIHYSGDIAKIDKVEDTIILNVGDKVMISTALPEDTSDSNLSFKIKDESIIEYDTEFNVLKALSKGNTTLELETNDKKYNKNIKIIIKEEE